MKGEIDEATVFEQVNALERVFNGISGCETSLVALAVSTESVESHGIVHYISVDKGMRF